MMLTFTKADELTHHVLKLRAAGKSIGFSPTMGALHDGHMQLIAASNSECDITVSSVFVNPTQFNDQSDLDKYPRTLNADAALLSAHSTDILFAPSVDQVYPPELSTTIELDFDGLDTAMEGEFRPGHFAGVAQVVKRLLDIVRPTHLYMGQKDFQQFTIIQHMITRLDLDTQLRVIPIARHDDGLAMSSRNVRLTPAMRKAAPEIYMCLKAIKRKRYQESVPDLEQYGLARLRKITGFRPEYVSIVDGYNLRPIDSMRSADYVVLCTAVWAGDVRLIDNLIIKKPRTLQIFVN